MGVGKRAPVSKWCRENMRDISMADELIGARLANAKQFQDYTEMSLCDQVFNDLRSSNTGTSNSSVLLLGEAGAGKTHLVEYCVAKLREAEPGVVVLRARGDAYSSDVECVRHMAAQISDCFDTPAANASFEKGMEWVRLLLKEGCQQATAVVIVLDKFEHFCPRGARQTLLYNLFDVAQDVGVRLSIIGISTNLDVMDTLEKRIRSRFSMRQLVTFIPDTMDGLVQILMKKLKLPPDSGLKGTFLKQFNANVEAALRAKKSEWIRDLQVGRPPTWFLWRCLPVANLLLEAADDDVPAAKRARTNHFAELTKLDEHTIRSTLLDGLSEVEHIVLIALMRMHERSSAARTLSLILHEIQLLHDGSGYTGMRYSPDRYSSAFDRLLQLRLVELLSSSDCAGKRYTPCYSKVDAVYSAFVRDLDSLESARLTSNPLRGLCAQVQRWARESRDRQAEPR